MKHCVRCGSELVKHTATKYVCASCQHEQFRNPKGAIAILLFDNKGKIILARRAHEPAKGKLDPIGGFLDLGENFEDALYRELAEETGLQPSDIAEVSYHGSAHDYYHWDGEDEPVISAYFTARLKPGKQPRAADDVASLKHLLLADIPLEECAWPGLAKMLKKLKHT